MVAGNSSESLPPGFIEKIKVSNGRKVKIYIESSTGNKFYSRLAVARYLKNEDMTEQPKLDKAGESLLKPPDTSLPSKSLTKEGCIPGKDLETEKSFTMVATESTSSGGLPPSEAGHNPGKKLNGKKSFTVVATESTLADGLPPGWVKEIKTTKSGNKSRKDSYYIDPVSGYMFFSKKDALRYLETNDISSCSSKPKRKKEFDDPLLNKNDINLDYAAEPILKSGASLQCKSMTHTDNVPEKKKKNKCSFFMVTAENTSADESPQGWIKETKTSKSGNKIRKDKPDDDVTFVKPDTPIECEPMTDEGCIPETKKRKHSFTAVTIESTSADGLPPGWIKEIKTSKSGNKIKKDPYYIDPVSGYIFFSKKDVMRFLKTNDIGSCAITPKRQKLDDLKLTENQIPLDNVAETFSKPKVHLQHEPMPDESCTPETKRSSKESFTTVATDSTSVEGLPPGWIKEIQTRKSGNRIRKYPYYIDPVSGYMFHSKKDVLRYLETNDISSCAITPKRREVDGLKLINNKIHVDSVGEPFLKSDIFLQSQPMVNPVCSTETQKKSYHSSASVCAMRSSKLSQDLPNPLKDTQVATEISSADGLPPGWIKEIVTSKSGNKVRKDPYYTDPVSGYVFRSKKDVLRFLETNDIGSCAITPKKRETYDLKLIKSTTSTPSRTDRKLSEHDHLENNSKLFFGQPKGGGGYSSGAKNLAASKAKILKIACAGAASIQDKKSNKNSDEHAENMFLNISSASTFSSPPVLTMKSGSEQTNACSEQGARAMAEVLAICSFINESFTEEKLPESRMEKQNESTKLPESGMEKQTDGTRLRPGKEKRLPDCGMEKQTDSTGLKPGKEKRLPESGMEKQSDDTGLKPGKEKRLPESGMKKQTDGTQLRPRKSKQIRDLNLPLRASKRHSRSDLEMIPNVNFCERALRASAKKSLAPFVPLPCDVEKGKEVANHALTAEETCQEEKPSDKDEKVLSEDDPIISENVPLNKVETPLAEDRAISEKELLNGIEKPSPKDISEKEPLNDFEKPLEEAENIYEKEPLKEVEMSLLEDNAISIEQTVGKALDKQLTGDTISQNPQSVYAFAESWTDPYLEFAFKTLTGEIPIDDNTLSFPGIPYNQEVGVRDTSESAAPAMFESDIPPGFESVKQNKIVQNLAANPPFSSPTESTVFQIDEIPPGFESVAQSKTSLYFPANPSFSTPKVSSDQGFPSKSS